MLFRFWFEDRLKPNNESRNEDCVELMPLDSGMNWNDLPCSAKRKGICEKFGKKLSCCQNSHV